MDEIYKFYGLIILKPAYFRGCTKTEVWYLIVDRENPFLDQDMLGATQTVFEDC